MGAAAQPIVGKRNAARPNSYALRAEAALR
jgi:hypothetical protein